MAVATEVGELVGAMPEVAVRAVEETEAAGLALGATAEGAGVDVEASVGSVVVQDSQAGMEADAVAAAPKAVETLVAAVAAVQVAVMLAAVRAAAWWVAAETAVVQKVAVARVAAVQVEDWWAAA